MFILTPLDTDTEPLYKIQIIVQHVSQFLDRCARYFSLLALLQ